MSKVRTIKTIDEAMLLRNNVLKSAEISKSNIISIASNNSALDIMYNLKFKEVGIEPLENKPINLIEQLNQMFTYLVSIEAVIYLMKIYPGMSFTLNLGTSSGYDVESVDQTVIAETFSATSPKSNGKLKKDIIRLNSNDNALHKYSFYYSDVDSPVYVENLKRVFPNVNIIKISLDDHINNFEKIVL